MPCRVSLIFQASTKRGENEQGRVGGWSEQFWCTETILQTTLEGKIKALSEARASLLPDNTAIIAQRAEIIDADTLEPTGGSRTYEFEYPGRAGTANALPSKALCWQMRSSQFTNHRTVILRGVPDARVVNGEYSYVIGYHTAVITYFAELQARWLMRGRTRTQQAHKIERLTAGGALTTKTPHGLVAGNEVYTLRARTASGLFGKGRCVVGPGAALNTATLIGFTPPKSGEDCVSGKVRKHGYVLLPMTIEVEELRYPDAITKKVGAPFKRFVGRR